MKEEYKYCENCTKLRKEGVMMWCSNCPSEKVLPPTPESPVQKLRQEFEESFQFDTSAEVNSFITKIETKVNKEQISDWWFSRTVPKETLQDIVKEIEVMKRDQQVSFSSDAVFDRGYNKALADIAEVVTRKIES